MLVEMLVVPVAPTDGQAPEEGGAGPGTGIAVLAPGTLFK